MPSTDADVCCGTKAVVAVIHLGRRLLGGSSNLPESPAQDGSCEHILDGRAGRSGSRLGLASDGVYRANAVTSIPVRSYRTFSPLPFAASRAKPRQAVCFLWHFPAGHLDRPLAGILPCEARTFLPRTRRIERAGDHLFGSDENRGRVIDSPARHKPDTSPIQARHKPDTSQMPARTAAVFCVGGGASR